MIHYQYINRTQPHGELSNMKKFNLMLLILLFSTTGLASYIIPNGSVTNAKLGNLAVTAAKIAASTITVDKMAPMASGTTVASNGFAISNNSSTFTSSASSYTDVTNLSVTITTTGRPVFVGMIGVGGILEVINGGGTFATATYRILRDGATDIAHYQMKTSVTGASAVTLDLPPSSVWSIDLVPAGTYTYKIQVIVASGSSANCTFANLIAYEL